MLVAISTDLGAQRQGFVTVAVGGTSCGGVVTGEDSLRQRPRGHRAKGSRSWGRGRYRVPTVAHVLDAARLSDRAASATPWRRDPQKPRAAHRPFAISGVVEPATSAAEIAINGNLRSRAFAPRYGISAVTARARHRAGCRRRQPRYEPQSIRPSADSAASSIRRRSKGQEIEVASTFLRPRRSSHGLVRLARWMRLRKRKALSGTAKVQRGTRTSPAEDRFSDEGRARRRRRHCRAWAEDRI